MTSECFLTPVPRSEEIYLGAFRETMIGFTDKPGPYFTARMNLMNHGLGIFKGICGIRGTVALDNETHRSVYSVLEIMPTRKVDAVRSSALFSDLERNSWHNFQFFYFDSVDMVGIIYTRPLVAKVKKQSQSEPITVRPTLSNASLLK